MSDKAEAALADWLMRRCGLEISPLSIREGAEQIVAAEFDALLADLPEEAVSAMEDAYLASDEPFDAAEEFRIAARAFLRSLRGDGA